MLQEPYLADLDHLKTKSAKYAFDSINSTLFMRNCLILWQSRIWLHILHYKNEFSPFSGAGALLLL